MFDEVSKYLTVHIFNAPSHFRTLVQQGYQTSDKSDLVSALKTYTSDIIGTLSTSIKAQKRANISQTIFELE